MFTKYRKFIVCPGASYRTVGDVIAQKRLYIFNINDQPFISFKLTIQVYKCFAMYHIRNCENMCIVYKQ